MHNALHEPTDKRRVKVANLLEDYGQRVQYSVFEARLSDRHLARLKEELAGLVDEEKDSVRFYRLCAACYGQVEVLGQGQVAADVEAYII